MKKIWYLVALMVIMVACQVGKKDRTSDGLVTYKYKVAGLQDSIVSDSIWRIIFQVDGIEKLVLSRDDSFAVFTVDPGLVSNELLRKEITRRGGVLLN